MTSPSEPDPRSPVSPLDLPQLVDELEERNRPAPAEVSAHESEDDVQEDVTADVPGVPEPPD